jgi:hypothetical protein
MVPVSRQAIELCISIPPLFERGNRKIGGACGASGMRLAKERDHRRTTTFLRGEVALIFVQV